MRWSVFGGGGARGGRVDDGDVLGQRRAGELELEDGRVEAAEKVATEVEHPFNPHTIRSHILHINLFVFKK